MGLYYPARVNTGCGSNYLHGSMVFLCWMHGFITTPMTFMGFPGKESTCNTEDLSSIPGSGRSPGEGIDYPLQCSWASLVAQLVKNPPATQETCLGLIPGLGRSAGERNGCPLQYSGLENSMNCIVRGVTRSRTGLSDFHFHLFIKWKTI